MEDPSSRKDSGRCLNNTRFCIMNYWMVHDPLWRKARLHVIAITFQHISRISYQFGNPGPEYRHQLQGMTINNLQSADDIVLVADFNSG